MADGQTILVTGAGGWIGGAVVRRLRDRGHAVACAGRDTPAAELAAAARAAAVVVHAGSGYSNARADFVDGGLAHAVAVAQGCARADNAVVFLSSAKVYGWAAGDAGTGPSAAADRSGERVCDERAACAGADNFSAAKRLAEELLGRAAARCTVLRISNAYGPGVPAKYALGTMLASAVRTGRVVLDCTGASRRDFVHHDDTVTVVTAAAEAALRDRSPAAGGPSPAGPSVVNVASGRLLALADVARLFADALGAEVEIRGRPPVSSPGLSNRGAIEAGYIDRFADPVVGIQAMLRRWRDQPWEIA